MLDVLKSLASLSAMRKRVGDSYPSLTLLAESSKLVGNSLYGKTIINEDKHKKMMYCLGLMTRLAKFAGRGFAP